MIWTLDPTNNHHISIWTAYHHSPDGDNRLMNIYNKMKTIDNVLVRFLWRNTNLVNPVAYFSINDDKSGNNNTNNNNTEIIVKILLGHAILNWHLFVDS